MPDSKPHPRRAEIYEIVGKLRHDGLHIEARLLREDWDWIEANVVCDTVDPVVFLDRCRAFERFRTVCLDMMNLAKGAA